MMFSPTCRIDPCKIAFDIDGVVADTMDVFVRLAHERYGLTRMTRDDLNRYNLYDCLDLEKEVIDDLISLTLDHEHTMQIPPVPGAPEVLTELACITPLRFVTARIWPESITEWLFKVLPDVAPERISVIASGDPAAKPRILQELEVSFFVEDRIDTCHQLKDAGIFPFLFDQPWNRGQDSDHFVRIENWMQFKEWLLPPEVNLR